jgi:hypothetical protein
VQEVLLWQTATIRMMYRIVAKAIAIKVRSARIPHMLTALHHECLMCKVWVAGQQLLTC